MKKDKLSILLPVYNTICVDFVRELQKQAAQAIIDYEIIVADDGSTCSECLIANETISNISHVRYIRREQNMGSAATRNFLARESQYPWLLFLDCDMQISHPHFLQRYLTALPCQVVNGGIAFGGDSSKLHSNLRYRYETHEAPRYTAAKRQRRPYQSFRSANFLITREVMLQTPFDERLRRYEDVLLGKKLQEKKISIAHIDNPVIMTDYDSNAKYLTKIEKEVHILHEFRNDLRGFSRLLTLAESIHPKILRRGISLLFKIIGPTCHQILCGKHPNLALLKIYRLAYYLSLTEQM